VSAAIRIRWHRQHERRYPFGTRSPIPEWFEAIGFPPPWPDRPWIYANMVASANGVVAWRRAGPHDDPVRAVLGGDEASPERLADRWQMRHLRCFGDVGVGAQTLREQPGLVQTTRERGDPPLPALRRFRVVHGLTPEPRIVVYSLEGCVDPALPVFHAPDAEVIMVTTARGADELRRCGVGARADLVADDVERAEGLRAAHRRLFADRGVRYLDCEGGDTVLRSLRAADLLDEVFVTVTDVVIDERRHEGVRRIFDFAREGAALVAEGALPGGSAWRFRRWRFNPR
jgi:5-amino-6-(5-phosphoribosylamino)uracil reductase